MSRGAEARESLAARSRVSSLLHRQRHARLARRLASVGHKRPQFAAYLYAHGPCRTQLASARPPLSCLLCLPAAVGCTGLGGHAFTPRGGQLPGHNGCPHAACSEARANKAGPQAWPSRPLHAVRASDATVDGARGSLLRRPLGWPRKDVGCGTLAPASSPIAELRALAAERLHLLRHKFRCAAPETTMGCVHRSATTSVVGEMHIGGGGGRCGAGVKWPQAAAARQEPSKGLGCCAAAARAPRRMRPCSALCLLRAGGSSLLTAGASYYTLDLRELEHRSARPMCSGIATAALA
jgi:hypothetical protein